MNIKDMKRQLAVAAVSVVMAAIALSSATYAWFVTNSHVDATTSTISAKTNNMVLQIVQGDTPDHGGKASTVAFDRGHEISPSSTNDAKTWHVPETWKATDVKTYKVANVDVDGKYGDGNGKSFYAYTLANYTLYTVKNTGKADVYLDGSQGSPITVTKSTDASDAWFNKIKGSLRVGILINGELRLVYAPFEPSGHGNDVGHTVDGWSCVDPESLSSTMAPTYDHLAADKLVDGDGYNWASEKVGDTYVKPTGNAKAIAKGVDYNGINMKVAIWMEGTDADCQNMNGLEPDDANPTFDVTLSLAGVAADSN